MSKIDYEALPDDLLRGAKSIETLTRELAEAKLREADMRITIADLAGQRDTLRAELTATKARLAEAVEVINGLVDDEPCWKDHRGHCQAHYLGDPCEMETARTFLAKQEASHD